jgi:hypothetical protein
MKKSRDLKIIIDTLLSDNYYNVGEYIEIAKGKNEYSTSIKTNYNKIKRILK